MLTAAIALMLGVGVIATIWWYVCRRFKRHANPFSMTWDFDPPDKSHELFAAQDETLERPFDWMEISEKQFDTVIIGSGIGGLSTAALLARLGRKVLVLEQFTRAGGACNAYKSGGVRFHAGLFCIAQYELQKDLITQLTDGQLKWSALKSPFDNALVGDSTTDFKRIEMETFANGFSDNLSQAFPENTADIAVIESLLKRGYAEVRSYTIWFVLLQCLPVRLAHLLASALERGWISQMCVNAKLTLDAVLTTATQNATLRAAVSYLQAYACESPADTNWLGYCLVLGTYLINGAHLPVGGSSKVPFDLIRAIEKRGGVVRVGADVRQITTDNSGRVNGVQVWSRKTQTMHKITANCVVSSAGIPTTFGKLLSDEVKTRYRKYVRAKGDDTRSHGVIRVSVVLSGSPAEFNLTEQRSHMTVSTDPRRYGDWLRKSSDQVYEELTRPHGADVLIYMWFPSSNPLWQKQFPGKTACECFAAASGRFFDDGKYPDLAELIAKSGWSQARRYYPQLTDDKVESFNFESLLQLESEMGRRDGAIYGNNMMAARYKDLHQVADIRAKTDVPGLYIAGHDLTVPGFNMASHSALLCASAISGRNLITDLLQAQSEHDLRFRQAVIANEKMPY